MTRLLRSSLVAVVLLFAATWASALVPAVTGWKYTTATGAPVFPDRQSACDAFSAVMRPTWNINLVATVDTSNNRCTLTAASNGSYMTNTTLIAVTSATCPANSTAVTGGCQCNANYDESGGQCVPHVNQCTSKTGQVGVLNWTEGYTRTPDEGDRSAVGGVLRPPPSGEVCDSGCAVSLQTSGPGVQPMVSQSPTSNGLYRRSVDFPSLGLGKECTMGTADVGAKKDAPPPDCPGSVGDLGDGKPVCVGTAAKPVTPTPLGAAPGAVPIAGNPPAGAKPATGEASGTGSAGRTPSTGNGTATGGPSVAAAGGKGGGAGGTATGTGSTLNGDGKQEKDPCGAPGQAVCNVKVDETGTPTSANGTDGTSYATKVDDLTKAQTDAFASVKDAKPGDWGFDFQLPTTCSPIALGMFVQGFQIDMCRWQSMIHDLMSLVWLSVTVWACIGMVGRTLSGGS